MNFSDMFKKKKLDEDELTHNHKALMVKRAKMLIDELVSPLSQPNHQLIDELMQIITQTASLPPSLVNKEEVLKTTKALLLKIIKPIPNPNKKLIEELLAIITNPEGSLVLNNLDDSKEEKKEPEKKKESADSEELRKQRTVVNLILQQIKELINITNSLNSKIKSLEPRLEAVETSVGQMKQKNEKIDEKLNDFEKNMEKFIGLYEVVTNQFNPFVESADTFDEEEKKLEQSNDIDAKLNNLMNMQEENENINSNITEDSSLTNNVVDNLMLNGKTILSFHDLEDELLNLSDSDFMQNRQNILNWIKVKSPKVYDDLVQINDKKQFLKTLLKLNP